MGCLKIGCHGNIKGLTEVLRKDQTNNVVTCLIQPKASQKVDSTFVQPVLKRASQDKVSCSSIVSLKL